MRVFTPIILGLFLVVSTSQAATSKCGKKLVDPQSTGSLYADIVSGFKQFGWSYLLPGHKVPSVAPVEETASLEEPTQVEPVSLAITTPKRIFLPLDILVMSSSAMHQTTRRNYNYYKAPYFLGKKKERDRELQPRSTIHSGEIHLPETKKRKRRNYRYDRGLIRLNKLLAAYFEFLEADVDLTALNHQIVDHLKAKLKTRTGNSSLESLEIELRVNENLVVKITAFMRVKFTVTNDIVRINHIGLTDSDFQQTAGITQMRIEVTPIEKDYDPHVQETMDALMFHFGDVLSSLSIINTQNPPKEKRYYIRDDLGLTHLRDVTFGGIMQYAQSTTIERAEVNGALAIVPKALKDRDQPFQTIFLDYYNPSEVYLCTYTPSQEDFDDTPPEDLVRIVDHKAALKIFEWFRFHQNDFVNPPYADE